MVLDRGGLIEAGLFMMIASRWRNRSVSTRPRIDYDDPRSRGFAQLGPAIS